MKNTKLFQSFIKKPKKQVEGTLTKSASFTKKSCVECSYVGEIICKTCNVLFCSECHRLFHEKEDQKHESTTVLNDTTMKSLSKKRRKNSEACIECSGVCTLFCMVCDQFYCEGCYEGLHSKKKGGHLPIPHLKCYECTGNTQNHCSKCSHSFCKGCFNKTHVKKDEEHVLLEFNLNYCSICQNARDIYCKDCQISFCKSCSLSAHQLPTRKDHNLLETTPCTECNEVSNVFCQECNQFFCDYCCSVLHALSSTHKLLILNRTQYIKQTAVLRKSSLVIESQSKVEQCQGCLNQASVFCDTCSYYYCKDCFGIVHSIQSKKEHMGVDLGAKCKDCGSMAREACKECAKELCSSCSHYIHLLKRNKTHERVQIRANPQKKKKDAESCAECNSRGTILCLGCCDTFCDECGPIIHQLPSRKEHQLKKIEDCSECEKRAKLYCSSCNQFYCPDCSLIIHSLEKRKHHSTLNWYGDDYPIEQQTDFRDNVNLLISKLKKNEIEVFTDSEEETLSDFGTTTLKSEAKNDIETVIRDFSNNSKASLQSATTYFWIELKKNPFYVDLTDYPSFPLSYARLFTPKLNVFYTIEERKEKKSTLLENNLQKKKPLDLFRFNSGPLSPRESMRKEVVVTEPKIISPFHIATQITLSDELSKKGPEVFKETNGISRRESFAMTPIPDINRRFLPFDREYVFLLTPKEILVQENVSCSLFFYDLTKEVKLTDDFTFLLQNKPKECSFTLNTSSSTFIVLIFEKLLYSSEEFGWIKQPLMFAYAELNHKEKFHEQFKIKTFYKFPEKKVSISSLIKGKGYKTHELKASVSFELSILEDKFFDTFDKYSLKDSIKNFYPVLMDLTKPSSTLMIYPSNSSKNLFFFEVGFKNKDDLSPPQNIQRCFVKNFYYEVKIDLPFILSEKDHIYFKFYDTDMKVVGYSFLLLLDEIVFLKGTKTVTIYNQLVNDYTSNRGRLENSKNTFEFNYHNHSNLYPLIQDTSLVKLTSLPKENIITSFPIIISNLLERITTSPDEALPVLFNIFKIVPKETLEDYIQFFYQPNEEIPLFYVLPEVLIQCLGPHTKDVLYYSNFFFDLTIKSILLQNNLFLIDIFLQSITNLISKFCKVIIEEEDVIGNRNLSFFIRDMISIFNSNPKVNGLIEEYILRMRYKCKHHIKFEFIQIMLDENFIVFLKDKTCVSYILPLVVEAISKDKVNHLFFNHVRKMSRKLDPHEFAKVYSNYFELIITKSSTLYSVGNEEDLYLILDSFCNIMINKNENDLLSWWQIQTAQTSIIIFKLFRAAVYFFSKREPRDCLQLFKLANLFFTLNAFPTNDELAEEISLFYLQALRFGSQEFISQAFESMYKFISVYLKEGSKETIKFANAWKFLVGGTLAYVGNFNSNTPTIVLKCLETLTSTFKGQLKEIETPIDQEITLDQKGMLKAASIGKLVELLFEESIAIEKNYENTFLITYLSFVSNEELLTHILAIYQKNSSNSLLNIRVYNFIAAWIKCGYYPFSISIYSRFVEILFDELLMTKYSTTHGKIKKILISSLTNVEVKLPVYYESFSKRNTERFDILEWSPLEIAKQLAIIEMQLFKKIQLKECFGLAWSKKNKEELAPNIVAISDRFNKMSNWIEITILKEKDLKNRQTLLSRFVQILKCSRELNNFQTTNQFIAALRSASIYRLKKTFEGVKDEDKKAMESIASIFEIPPYTELKKQILKLGGTTCVPFIGIYLTDLTFIEDGNPNEIKNKDKKYVNFFKRRLFSNTLKDIQLFQQNTYKYPSNEFLNEFLTSEVFKGLPNWNSSQSYEQSTLLEPKTK